MAFGEGNYDAECVTLLGLTGASACVLLVIQGSKGEGISLTIDQVSHHARGRHSAPAADPALAG